VHLDADPVAVRSQRSAPDDALQLRLADGAAHRDEALAQLRSIIFDEGPLRPDSADRPAIVLAPSLRSGTRFGIPDVLLWDGDGYRPVVIRSHRTTDPGAGALISPIGEPLALSADVRRKLRPHAADALALAHHHRLLSELGLASNAAMGGVIGRGADDGTVIAWHQLDLPGASVLADYDLRFADRLAVASAAANGRAPLAVASRIGECRRCSWWPVCSAELEARRDISLIAAGADVDVLHGAGITTVDDLAEMDATAAAVLPLTGLPPSAARARARAWLRGITLVRKNERVQVRRADLELDVDMESFLEDGAYLWGTYLTGPAVADLGLTPGYRPFVSWQPLPDADEGRAFAAFWAYLAKLRSLAAKHGLTFAAYCYSRSAEERWLRSTPSRYPDVSGMPSPAQVDEFCTSSDWVDIYQEIKEQFLVTGSMRLKALAPVAGFSWRDPEPGGENSMAWYRVAVGAGLAGIGRPIEADGTVGPIDRELADRILRYNEDDVLATLALRQWMTDRATEVPTAAELDAD
jgi:predicted RecB family nuclease